MMTLKDLVLWIAACLTTVVLLFVLLVASADAKTLVEPTTNSDATPLDDLAECKAIVTDQIGRTGHQIFPAASPSGGGSHVFDPATILPIGEGAIDIYGTCTDTGGAESAESNHLSDTFPVIPPTAPALSD